VYGKAIVRGKEIRYRLSPELEEAWRLNEGKTMTDQEAIDFVEEIRRKKALRRAKPYLESRP